MLKPLGRSAVPPHAITKPSTRSHLSHTEAGQHGWMLMLAGEECIWIADETSDYWEYIYPPQPHSCPPPSTFLQDVRNPPPSTKVVWSQIAIFRVSICPPLRLHLPLQRQLRSDIQFTSPHPRSTPVFSLARVTEHGPSAFTRSDDRPGGGGGGRKETGEGPFSVSPSAPSQEVLVALL